MTQRPRRRHLDPMKKLVGYVRVSSVAGRKDERFKSPELQQEVLHRWAEARYGDGGYEWVGWFKELDRTGMSIDRPGLNEARALAVAEQADIVVYDLARYSRSVPEGLSVLQTLQEAGVQVLSASEDLDASTPDGELSLTLFLAMSQHYTRRISTSWRRAIDENRREGWWHGRVPYGYRCPTKAEAAKLGRSSGVIVPDKQAAKHVQEIFRRFLAGESIYAIGRYGRLNGWFKKDGTARVIVSNPVYAGMVRSVETAPARSKKTGSLLRDNHGRVRNLAKPGSERYFRGQHTPLVSAKDVVRARKRLEREARPAAPRPLLPRWSAAGRTRCYSCGRTLAFHDKSASLDLADGLYLACPNRDCRARPGSVKVAEFELALAAAIKALPFQVEDMAKELRARQAAQRATNAESRAQVKYQRDKVKSRIATVSAAILTGEFEDLGVSEAEARLALGQLRAELARRDEQLESLGPTLELLDDFDIVPSQTVALADLWDKMTITERVAALEALGAVVKIKPSRKHNDSLDGRLVITLPFDPTAEFDARRRDSKESPAVGGSKPTERRRRRA